MHRTNFTCDLIFLSDYNVLLGLAIQNKLFFIGYKDIFQFCEPSVFLSSFLYLLFHFQDDCDRGFILDVPKKRGKRKPCPQIFKNTFGGWYLATTLSHLNK